MTQRSEPAALRLPPTNCAATQRARHSAFGEPQATARRPGAEQQSFCRAPARRKRGHSRPAPRAGARRHDRGATGRPGSSRTPAAAQGRPSRAVTSTSPSDDACSIRLPCRRSRVRSRLCGVHEPQRERGNSCLADAAEPSVATPIGTRSLHWIDRSRREPYARDGRPRELMVQLWYPAQRSGRPRARYMPTAVAKTFRGVAPAALLRRRARTPAGPLRRARSAPGRAACHRSR